jgi:hypothetical protein
MQQGNANPYGSGFVSVHDSIIIINKYWKKQIKSLTCVEEERRRRIMQQGNANPYGSGFVSDHDSIIVINKNNKNG